ncbi:MAG: tRNA adenosine(34) deaminase TadA [Bacillota bacterium]|nr:tRNA adenosine(34) deaminase TadA [Bacillota bacterium]
MSDEKAGERSIDEKFMREALKEARRAAAKREVPVGAVIVKEGRVIARGHNLRERLGDPTAHAEMLAMREAALVVGGWRLNDCTLYVTMEPCPMCAGAAVQARLDRIVYGARDPKGGAAGSCVDLLAQECFNHRVEVTGGVCEEACARLLKEFFQRLRGGTEALPTE